MGFPHDGQSESQGNIRRIGNPWFFHIGHVEGTGTIRRPASGRFPNVGSAECHKCVDSKYDGFHDDRGIEWRAENGVIDVVVFHDEFGPFAGTSRSGGSVLVLAELQEQFTADALYGFTHLFLLKQYDEPKPVPPFHLEMWDACCDLDDQHVAIAAPRSHAKSTAITHAFTLMLVCLRIRQNVLIVSATESLAAAFLSDVRTELEENTDLRDHFGIKKIVKATDTDVRVRCEGGYFFRIFVKGAEQKLRGVKWRNKRPDAIICDDIEEDEAVLNPERRRKFAKWFQNALLPCGSDSCIFRVVGTVLHLDSLLNGLLDDSEWTSLRFRAHKSFNNFLNILWPEKFSEKRLRSIRQKYLNKNNPEGYSQEYLNEPVAEGETYFRKQDFLPMQEDDFTCNKVYFAAADLAISEREQADYTVMGVAGMDAKGMLHFEDVRRFRGDADDIIKEMLSLQKRYNPEIFTIETEKIDKAIGPSLNRAQIRSGLFMNIEKVTPSKSKTIRGSSFQARHKAGGTRWNKDADWYEECEGELMTVGPSGPRGKHDDYFDFVSYIGLTIDKYYEASTPEEDEQETWEEEEEDFELYGVCDATGY